MSTKLKCHTKISSKLEFQQDWNITKTEMLKKGKCNQNYNVTKTEMLPN